jgi:hypothetical protein
VSNGPEMVLGDPSDPARILRVVVFVMRESP